MRNWKFAMNGPPPTLSAAPSADGIPREAALSSGSPVPPLSVTNNSVSVVTFP